MTTVRLAVAAHVLELRLPGEWAIVPLDDPSAARRAVGALARHAAGSAVDEAAVLRSPLVATALAEIDRGIAARASASSTSAPTAAAPHLLIARSIVEGVALPLSILVAPLDQPVTPALAPTDEAVLEVLALALDARDDGFSDAVRPDHGRRLTLRRQRVVPARSPEPDGRSADDAVTRAAASAPRLEIEHWLAVPATRHVVRLLSSTPVIGMNDVIVGFVDAIVRAARWEHPPPSATPSLSPARED